LGALILHRPAHWTFLRTGRNRSYPWYFAIIRLSLELRRIVEEAEVIEIV